MKPTDSSFLIPHDAVDADLDVAVAHEEAAVTRVLTAPFLLLIAFYQRLVSPVLHAALGPACGCRFYPSCSHYAADALRTHGLLRGLVLAVWRLLRCTPLSEGGPDPVPPRGTWHPRCERIHTGNTAV